MSNLLESLQCLLDNGLTEHQVVGLASDILEADSLDDSDDQKALVLVAERGAGYLDAEEANYDDCVFSAGGEEWLVCTEDEKEERWDACLESYLDDGWVEGAESPYFDREAWKRDAHMDGAGHALSGYDGNEYEFNTNNKWFFLYRLN